MLTRVLAFFSAIAAALAVFFRLSSKRHQAEAKQQRQRAEVANIVAVAVQRIDQAREEVQQRHRSEQQTLKREVEAGLRDHLDNAG
ncbi:MAG: hypothetical protein OEZ16_07015 [Chromatiales bacterium]|nr:hypothetical protein [Chromatiales bacterium]